MILYHFTTPEKVPAILRDGLIASGERGNDNDIIGGLKVVWLTDVPTMEWSLERRKVMLRRGLLCGPRFRNLPDATVCLKLVIPTTDKSLKHFRTWLKKHPQPEIDTDDPLIEPQNWFYASDIAPDRLSVFKTVPRGVGLWDLPTIRKKWLIDGIETVLTPEIEADLLAGRAGPDDYVKAHSDTA
jgi:hypothetical protein